MADAPATETVTITIDGKQVEAKPGELIIAAAERAGTYIPRFCYHPRMRPVGMCRMCLVEVNGPRGPMLTPACFVPVAEGQEIVTDSPTVKKAQDGVLEFLLINHPLDCPVCDKGGECPLQDQTLAFGPGETRFVEEKRHWEKPIALSDLVLIDRERCIQCDRCTRFSDEIAGDPLIEFVGRGDHTEVNTFPDQPFASYFSGNTVQLCPVGALLAKPYRFKARPWDLEQVESTCTMCAFGCRTAVQSSANALTRYIGIDVDPVNHGWLCDKGRFSYEWVNSEERLTAPLVRKRGRASTGEETDELVEASWGEALAAAAAGIRNAREKHGVGSIAVLGGARLPNEDQYAWAKLAKGVLGTDNVDAQLGDGLPAEVVLGLPRATIDEACSADAVLLLAPDLKEALPVLYLRLRGAVVNGKTKLVELSPKAGGLTKHAAATLGYRPGEAAAVARALVAPQSPSGEVGGVSAEALTAARQALGGGKVVVVLGRPSLAESAESIVEAAGVLAGLPNVSFLSALSRANVHGALDMGLAPGLLPGRVTLEDGREWWGQKWSATPETPGMDAAGILQAAAAGRVQALVLLGADPATDFPDRQLGADAVRGAGFVVAVDTFLNESSRQADVVLPAAGYAERPGTTTNIEGRVFRLGQKIVPPGVAWPDWMIASELAARLGGDLGVETIEDLWSEITSYAPSHMGVDRVPRDGVVVPCESPVEETEVVAFDPTQAPEVAAVATQGDAESPPPAVDASDDDAAEEAEPAEPAAPALPTPSMVSFAAPADAAPLPKLDGYALRLVVTKELYDDGTLLQHSPSMANLARMQVVRANHYDLDRLGLGTGGRVRVTSPRATFTAEAVVDDGVPRGSVALAFGDQAGALIDIGSPVVDVRLENV